MQLSKKLSGGISLLVVLIVAVSVFRYVNDRRPPSLSLLDDLAGFQVRSSKTFEGEGSLERGLRLTILDSVEVSPDATVRSIRDQLIRRDWTFRTPNGGLSPDGSVCLGVDSPKNYLADPLRSEDKKNFVRSSLGQNSMVITMFKC